MAMMDQGVGVGRSSTGRSTSSTSRGKSANIGCSWARSFCIVTLSMLVCRISGSKLYWKQK